MFLFLMKTVLLTNPVGSYLYLSYSHEPSCITALYFARYCIAKTDYHCCQINFGTWWHLASQHLAWRTDMFVVSLTLMQAAVLIIPIEVWSHSLLLYGITVYSSAASFFYHEQAQQKWKWRWPQWREWRWQQWVQQYKGEMVISLHPLKKLKGGQIISHHNHKMKLHSSK